MNTNVTELNNNDGESTALLIDNHKSPCDQSRSDYKVLIDDEIHSIAYQNPSAEYLLELAGHRACAYELIECGQEENCEIGPRDPIELDEHRVRRFITAHRQTVTIFIKDQSHLIKRVHHSVDQILGLVGETAAGYNLYEEKPGQPPMPVPENEMLNIVGCEIFTYQVKSGKSS